MPLASLVLLAPPPPVVPSPPPSEEILKTFADQMRDGAIPEPRKYYRYGETLTPDVWFDAKAVWEVKAADLSISPVHKAAQGLVDADKGISIRWVGVGGGGGGGGGPPPCEEGGGLRRGVPAPGTHLPPPTHPPPATHPPPRQCV